MNKEAVAWLERNYDEELALVTEKFESEQWESTVIFYWVPSHRGSNRSFLTVKDQDG